MNRTGIVILCGVLLLLQAGSGQAGIGVIDKIYQPYVQPMEQELEWRALYQDRQPGEDDHRQLHRLAYGRSLNDRWFAEVYLLAGKSEVESFDLEGYEVEAKWQLTEQGEFWADWGLLFEVEKDANENAWEFSTGILAEKEWGKWSATANLFLAHEWGSAIDNEWEGRLGLRARYRYSRLFEPAIEFYGGKDTRSMGPALLGQLRVGAGRQFEWDAGVFFGLDNNSPNLAVRINLAFEF